MYHDAVAKHFVSVNNISELSTILKLKDYPNKLILGGGSNMLLTQNQDALVIHIDLKGITVISEDEDFAFVKVNAG